MENSNYGKNTQKKVPDAPHSNWVDNYCPSAARPYLRLSRLDRPIGNWLLLIPCWWGSCLALTSESKIIDFNDYWIIFSCVVGAVLMRGAGCTWNDISDRNLDLKVKRTKFRPIPAGQVSIRNAIFWMFAQLLVSLFILLSFNKLAIIVGLCSIFPVLIYPYAKRFTWWPQLFLGIAFNWGILLSFSAHQEKLNTSVFLLYLAGIFWTLFYDTIYAHQDREDDALAGIKSTALLFGDKTHKWLQIFCVISTCLAMTSFIMSFKNLFNSQLTLILIGVFGYAIHLFLQTKKLDIGEPELCLVLFRSNRNAGLIIVMFSLFAVASRF